MTLVVLEQISSRRMRELLWNSHCQKLGLEEVMTMLLNRFSSPETRPAQKDNFLTFEHM